MSEELGSPVQDPEPEDVESSGRNPFVIFVGFLLLGAALALLLFGRDLLGGSEGPVIISGSSTTILDQVSELPALGLADEQPPGSVSGGILAVGDEAYDFTLSDLDGNLVRLADFRGQPVIVNFWATWCAPCRIEMPEMQEAFDKYQEDELVILALDQGETVEVAREFFYDEMGLTFTPLLDESSAISTEYGSFGVLPSTYFVNASGVVSAIHRGPLTLNQIDNYLAGMLSDAGEGGRS
jgi:cytochrome c biogenesis protein CcmG/thiol:disulfide interchange protein DsbE